MPESVKRRGSSGPTIGATSALFPWPMRPGGLRERGFVEDSRRVAATVRPHVPPPWRTPSALLGAGRSSRARLREPRPRGRRFDDCDGDAASRRAHATAAARTTAWPCRRRGWPPTSPRSTTSVARRRRLRADELAHRQLAGRRAVGLRLGFVARPRGYILDERPRRRRRADTVRVRVGDGADLIPAQVAGTDASSDLAVHEGRSGAAIEARLEPLAARYLRRRAGRRSRRRASARPSRLQASLTDGVIVGARPLDRSRLNGFARSSARRCRPTRPSTPATPAARCSTRSGERHRHQRADRDRVAVQQRRRVRDPDRHRQAGRSRSSSAAARIAARLASASRRRARPTAAWALVAAVISGGPAAKAGVRAGDRITKVGRL